MSDPSKSKPQAKFYPARKTSMLPAGSFVGRTALVTGGGTGLGRGMALMLSQLGAAVAIMGRRQNVLDETAKAITEKTGNRVLPCSADIRNVEAVHEALNHIEKEIGLPTALINNAAGNFISPTERLSANAFKTIIDIVLQGSANVTLDLGKRLIAAKKGASILSITTTYTFRGSGFVTPSAAAKSGVENMTRSLAAEWGRYGIRANCIAPGPIETEGAFSRLDPDGKFMTASLARIPAGRLGEIEELANLASYMLSDYANWMTGETVVLDGGELTAMAGEFNQLASVTNEQWDEMEKTIRGAHASQKKK